MSPQAEKPVKNLLCAFLFCLALLVPRPTAGQQRKPAPSLPKLMSLADVIDAESFSRTQWELAGSEPEKYHAKTQVEAVADLNAFIGKTVTRDERRGYMAEHALFVKYRQSLTELVSLSPRPLFYLETHIRFALKDNSVTLLLTTLGSNSVYNTLRLDAKQRAAKEIEKTLLTAMKSFEFVKAAGIENFGVLGVYGSKDFSESDESPKAEVVALVARIDRCMKLAHAQLSEEEFVDTADVYLVDRDMIGGLRKVKISLENKGK